MFIHVDRDSITILQRGGNAVKKRDYYTILGVSRSETTSGIRAAFRRLAKTHHPDLAGSEKTRYFQEITEAYCVLCRPATREDYNKSLQEEERQKGLQTRAQRGTYERRAGFGQRKTDAFHQNWLGTSDIIDFFFRDFFGTGTHRKADHFLDVEVILTPEEASRGGFLPIPITVSCPTCRGSGRVSVYSCSHCSGRGTIESRQSARVHIPPNILDGTVLEIPVYPYQSILRAVVRIRNLR